MQLLQLVHELNFLQDIGVGEMRHIALLKPVLDCFSHIRHQIEAQKPAL